MRDRHGDDSLPPDSDDSAPSDGSESATSEAAQVNRVSVSTRHDGADRGRIDDRAGDDSATVVAEAPSEADGEPEADVSEPDADADAASDTDTDTDADGAEPADKPKKKKSVLAKLGIGTLIVLAVLGGLYVGAVYFLGDRVPADTSVAGVDVSGLSVADAEQRLEEELGAVQDSPLALQFDGDDTAIEPAAAGLTFDAEATVARFTGFTWDPRVLMGHLFGLGDQEPVTRTDDSALRTALTGLAGELNVEPVEGAVAITEDNEFEVTEPSDGVALDVDGAAQVLSEQWLEGSTPIELPSEVLEPQVGPQEIAAVQSGIIDPLTSGPVTVRVGDDTEVELTVEELIAAASLQGEGADYQLTLDGEELADVVMDREESIGEQPSNAQIRLEGGEPTIIPAVTGIGLDPEQLGAAVQEAALSTEDDDRIAVAELTETDAEFTTQDAEELGVVEEIGYFSTPYPAYDVPRTANLQEGARKLTNVLLRPGDVFSLDSTLGPYTAANGYHHAGIVVDSVLVRDYGGGLSQVSTTLFNAAFEAGLEDVQHRPHTRYFDRYPAGHEATLYAGQIDMQFRNNTEHGVLIQSWLAGERLHVRLWGTQTWDVRITTGERYNFRSAGTTYSQAPECIAEAGGVPGFSIDYRRVVSRGGEVHEDRSYSWTYSPSNRVVCGPEPGSDSDD